MASISVDDFDKLESFVLDTENTQQFEVTVSDAEGVSRPPISVFCTLVSFDNVNGPFGEFEAIEAADGRVFRELEDLVEKNATLRVKMFHRDGRVAIDRWWPVWFGAFSGPYPYKGDANKVERRIAWNMCFEPAHTR